MLVAGDLAEADDRDPERRHQLLQPFDIGARLPRDLRGATGPGL